MGLKKGVNFRLSHPLKGSGFKIMGALLLSNIYGRNMTQYNNIISDYLYRAKVRKSNGTLQKSI